MAKATCQIVGCVKPSRTRGWCNMHYTRWSRHGDPLAIIRDGSSTSQASHGYIWARAAGHPLAMQNGGTYQHRLVLWDKIGPGSHPCAWCGDPVDWFGGTPATRLEVDHIDANRANNDPANLAPSCHHCNVNRNGIYKLKWTHCPNGHEYTPENQVASVRDHRKCRECRLERQRRYEARKRAERQTSR